MAKSRLLPGFIDLGIGEPHVLREEALRHYDLTSVPFTGLRSVWEYAPPFGYEPLVRRLEEEHGTRVVVTVGAKQGLAAAMHALSRRGHRSIGLGVPYWASLPSIARSVGLDPIATSHSSPSDADSFLMVSPNNPDGGFLDYSRSVDLCERLSGLGIPVVHDAAYYNHAHLPKSAVLGPLGDMQVFSCSKSLGLSGLRLGYVVCHDRSYYDDVAGYVESTTAGVSTASQRILLRVLEAEEVKPWLRVRFHDSVRSRLEMARELVAEALRPDVVRFVRDPRDAPGMFAWGALADGVSPESAGVNVMHGSHFGSPGMVRINLAVPLPELAEAVLRLNGLARGA